jgi:hypothetical protein
MAWIIYPMLTHMNYSEWSAVMHVNLQAVGLWEAVQHDDIEYRDDRHVLAALLHAMPVDMQVGLTIKGMAREAWESIHNIWVGMDRVKEANAEQLRQEFVEIRFNPGEGVEDCSICITALVNELWVLTNDITIKEVVKKMLQSILEKLEQLAISMETLLDLNSLSIEEAASHL